MISKGRPRARVFEISLDSTICEADEESTNLDFVVVYCALGMSSYVG